MKRFFYNVDTQKDFMNSDGGLYVNGAEDIKENLTHLTKYAKTNNIKVINSADYHNMATEEISDNPDFKTTFPMHCMGGSDGANFIEETQLSDPLNIIFKWDNTYSNKLIESSVERIREIIITKDKFNVFEGSPHADKIFNYLKAYDYTEAYVYGVAGDVCVKHVVDNLLSRNFTVNLILDATASIDINCMEDCLKKWNKKKNFKQLSTSDVINK